MAKSKRNLLLLGATLLTVGLLVEYLQTVILKLPINIVAKTILVMLMIAIGFGFAAAVMAPWARSILRILMAPFMRAAGKGAGRALFYIVIYAILFVAYLLYFIL
ncbi:hypothetical protein ACFL0V_05300 [Nanoarchaeota archaeon]